MLLCQGEYQKGIFVPPWMWREVNTDWRQVNWKCLSLLFSILQGRNCPYFVCLAHVPCHFEYLTLSEKQFPKTVKKIHHFPRFYHVNILPGSVLNSLLQISLVCLAKINYVREQLGSYNLWLVLKFLFL